MSAARRLGRYELGEIIGTGGVAEVVRAQIVGAGDFRRAVVIKRVRAELRDNPEVREVFVREAVLAQRLHHGNIVQVLDLGDDDGLPYIALELVDGCTLQRLLDGVAAGGAAIPLAAALHVVEQIATALQYVHGVRGDDGAPLGLVHRDVTPANVLLGKDGVVKLTDFGIARAAALGSDTLPGFIKGTALYLAPEQAAGRPVDARADVYALGLVLRRMLVGDGGLGDLHPELAAIVDAATEPAVRDRLASAEVMLTRLQRHRADVGLGSGVDELVALVTAAAGAPSRRVVSLDRALGGHAPRTRQVAPSAGAIDLVRGERRPRGWQWGLGGLAVVAIAVAVLAPNRAREPEAKPELRPATIESPTPEPAPATTVRAPAQSEPTVTPTVTAPPPVASVTPVATARDRVAPSAVARGRGRLKVNPVPYAKVSIDGVFQGDTPLDESVRAGKHTLELYNPDTGRRKSFDVTIEPDKTLNITHW